MHPGTPACGSTPRAIHPRRLLAGLAALAACLSAAAGAVAATSPRYSVTSFTVSSRTPYPLAISSNGKIAGALQIAGGYHAFVWEGNTFTEIPTLADPSEDDATTSVGEGVNASGHVVGLSQISPAGDPRPFLYKNGTVTDLTTILGGDTGHAYGINNSGVIVGTYGDPNFGNAFVLQPDNSFIDLGPGIAFAVSENGRVVGTALVNGDEVPFVFRDANNNGANDPGEFFTLGALGSSLNNAARGVNENGAVVGFCQEGLNGPTQAVYWANPAPDAAPTVLPSLGNSSFASGINNAGTIVGVSNGVACQWENGQVQRLDELIPRQQQIPTHGLYYAAGINSAGQIAVQGVELSTNGWVGIRLNPAGGPPSAGIQLQSLTVDPGEITLKAVDQTVYFTLTLSAKPTRQRPAQITLQVLHNGTPLAQPAFNLTLNRGKPQVQVPLTFNKDNIQPGTYEVMASVGGVSKSVTLVINPAEPLALETFALYKGRGNRPSTGTTTLKQGATLRGELKMSDLPSAPVEVELALFTKDGTTPIEIGGIPVVVSVPVDQQVEEFSTGTSLLPAGEYLLRATYGSSSHFRYLTITPKR